jgi:hypothetical protein
LAAKCAYCGNARLLTREHVWPRGFLVRGKYAIKYSRKADKTFRGDLVVRDVCSVCNSGPLSNLDSYACSLFDRYFSKEVEFFQTIQFDYEYGMLLRWLIKVSYNAARATNPHDSRLLSLYTPAILCESECSPIYANVFLATVGPETVLDKNGDVVRKIYPVMTRSGPILFPDLILPDGILVRAVYINAFAFTLLITESPVIESYTAAELIKRIPGVPLALEGSMITPMPSFSTFQAAAGVETWPRQVDAHKGKT